MTLDELKAIKKAIEHQDFSGLDSLIEEAEALHFVKSNITVDMVKSVMAATGQGMQRCKDALILSKLDVNAAILDLQKRGSWG